MTTLYDMLDVRPDDDAETVKDAFRKAVKVSHPDLNADDPDAAARFKEVVRANAILSDPELRAVYDRMLEFERQQHQPASVAYNIVPDAIVVVVLAVVMAGAYTLYTNLPEISIYLPKIPIAKLKVAANTTSEPSAAVVRPSAPVEADASDSPREKLESAKIPASIPTSIPVPGTVALTEASAVAALDAAHAPVGAAAPSSPPADEGTGASSRQKVESGAPAPSAIASTDNGVVAVEDVTHVAASAAAVQPSPSADTSTGGIPRDKPESNRSPASNAVARTDNGVVAAEDVTHVPANAAVPPSPADANTSTPNRDEGATTSVPSAVAPAPSAAPPPTTGAAAPSSPPADEGTGASSRQKVESGAPAPSAIASTDNGVVAVEDVTHVAASAAAVQPSPSADANTSGSTPNRDEGATTSVPSAVAPTPSAAPPPTTGAAVEKNPSGGGALKDATFYREQGMESYRNGDLPKAIADFDRAIQLNPNFEEAYIDRGIALYRLQKFDRAFADVAQAKRIENSHRTAASAAPKAHSN